jgi:hypothetical protein
MKKPTCGRSARRPLALAVLAIALLAFPFDAAAQNVELTVFLGRAFPTFDDRLILRAPAVPAIPEIQVTANGTPELRTDGGPVFGAALAFQAGPIGIEGRLDVTEIDFDVTGARYDLRATVPQFGGLSGSVAIGDGRFDAERLKLLSLNLRLRTPGPLGLVASGGLSYLPDVTIVGSVPVSVQLAGVSVLPGVEPRLRLFARPGQSDHRWGVNAGAGVRVGGQVSLVAEARVFYFRSYELAFELDEPFPFVSELLASLEPVRFKPIIVNAQAGVSFRF